MPKAPNTEVGRRIFLLRRLNAVEEALRAIRTRLGSEWKELSSSDRTLLNEILGNVWTETGGETWDSIHFSRLSAADLYRIIDIARSIHSGEITELEGTETTVRILTGTV